MAKHDRVPESHAEHGLHHDTRKGAGHHSRHEHMAHHDGREHEGRGATHAGARGAPHEDRSIGNHGRSADGIRGREGYVRGSDAAYMEPRLIPDYELLPRDDSGGPEFDPYTAEFGDGGYTTGAKAHLSVRGGRDDAEAMDEEAKSARRGRG
jgi:hypothetical protein